MAFSLGIRPCSTREGSDGLTKGEVDPFDKGGLDEGTESL